MSIRLFLILALLASAVTAQPVTLRIAAANASSGGEQSYDPGHGIRILNALQPDIVLIQEFRYLGGTLKDLVSKISGPQAQFYRDTKFAAAPRNKAERQRVEEEDYRLPNGIISRYPIRQAGTWRCPGITDRGLTWARIDIPGDKDLWAISVHLKAGKNVAPEGSAKAICDKGSADLRQQQAQALIDLITKNIPKDDFIVIGGDFNTWSRTEDCVKTLGNTVVVAAPFPSDQRGNNNTNAKRERPYDWVCASDNLDDLSVPTVVGSQSFRNGLVFDSRVDPALFPGSQVEPNDSGAQEMQHMVVVRDFKLAASATEARPQAGRERARPVQVNPTNLGTRRRLKDF